MPTLVPAATTIANSLVTQFSADVHHAVQQTTIKTKPYVKMKALAGKDLAYDGIGSVDMREVSGLFVPVEFDDPAYNRRQLSNRRFVLSLPIDEKADIEQILSVDSEYRTLVANAITRRFDRLVIEAALASINTGANFGTVVTAAADGVVNVNATTGLNYDFLLEIIENWVNKEVHDQYKNFGLCIDGAGHTALMKEIELVSGDYSRQFYVEKGMIQKAAGIDLLAFGNGVTNPMFPIIAAANPANISGVDERQHFAIAEGGVCVGIAKDFDIKLYDDTRYYNTRVLEVSAFMGAVRTEGALIQRVITPA